MGKGVEKQKILKTKGNTVDLQAIIQLKKSNIVYWKIFTFILISY